MQFYLFRVEGMIKGSCFCGIPRSYWNISCCLRCRYYSGSMNYLLNFFILSWKILIIFDDEPFFFAILSIFLHQKVNLLWIACNSLFFSTRFLGFFFLQTHFTPLPGALFSQKGLLCYKLFQKFPKKSLFKQPTIPNTYQTEDETEEKKIQIHIVWHLGDGEIQN